MTFQFSDGEISDPIATALKMWKKKINSFIVIIAFSVTLEILNRNPQACPPPPPLKKNSFTHCSLAPPPSPLENLLRGPWNGFKLN